jgi:ribose/xylose/arabinose/galactoside ABC-type transport system permease subunit
LGIGPQWEKAIGGAIILLAVIGERTGEKVRR